MFGATLYRFRRAAAKKPWTIVIVLLAVAMMIGMLILSSFDMEEIFGVKRISSVINGFSIVLFTAFFDLIFFTGIIGGATGYSFADVNFHFAGPFTPKFNLIISAISALRFMFFTLWMVACYSGLFASHFGLNFKDVILLLLCLIPIVLVSYGFAVIIGVLLCEKLAIRRILIGAVLGLQAIMAGVIYFGHQSSISNFDTMCNYIGTSKIFYAFPISGWVSLIYKGYIDGETTSLIWGSSLLLVSAIALIVLYKVLDLDYYEEAMSLALRVNEMREAKKAGIDSDHAAITRGAKVGKEVFNKGWGVSALFHRHLFENIRASKLFFINGLTIVYRIVCVFYMMIASANQFEGINEGTIMLVEGLGMFILLSVMLFSGGKTVMEFTKPFIYLIPEKSSAKLFSCLMSELPEMMFDSLICAVLLGYYIGFTPAILIGVFVIMTASDIFAEMSAIICIRIFRGLGKYTLTMVRNFIVTGLIFVIFIPAIILSVVFKSVAVFMIAASILLIIIDVLVVFFCGGIIDKIEYES